MKREDSVFLVEPSTESDRPVIDFEAPANQDIDWHHLDCILQGSIPDISYRELSIEIHMPNANSWDYYSVPGTLGLISARAVECVSPSAFYLFTLFPAKLNGIHYFFLKPSEVLTCLDIENSDVITFRSNPGRIKEIKKFAFHKETIADPLFFSIPEVPGLFATPGVHEALLQSGVQGFCFTPLG